MKHNSMRNIGIALIIGILAGFGLGVLWAKRPAASSSATGQAGAPPYAGPQVVAVPPPVIGKAPSGAPPAPAATPTSNSNSAGGTGVVAVPPPADPAKAPK